MECRTSCAGGVDGRSRWLWARLAPAGRNLRPLRSLEAAWDSYEYAGIALLPTQATALEAVHKTTDDATMQVIKTYQGPEPQAA
ncbi:hypothetical protein KCMC57_up02110 [Kitasatospora sp. CMC57]|uniref:Uncharacterized protein n=1 Tax=Kitasatospora sp. CMC57 TaxID=3231513 RepID=A0AB33JP49_9ACTN